MTKTKKAPEIVHDVEARRLGPGVYRAECSPEAGCGWVGELHEGEWREARSLAIADADQHAGREPQTARGATPNRPMRIPDPIWNAVLGVAEDEGLSASEISRQALAADPRVAARIEAVSA